MKVEDVRVFIPSHCYQESQDFYQALGFTIEFVNADLSLVTSNSNTFFLHRSSNNEQNEGVAKHIMLQLIVADISAAFQTVTQLKAFEIKFDAIKHESWGSVFYLWGPAGELLHITALNAC